jgi:hypothetical protein
MAQQWAYKVVYIDYRGRISSEGVETLIGNERRSTFARRYLNGLGKDGWELVGIQPLTGNSAYYVFKRPAQEGDFADATFQGSTQQSHPNPAPTSGPTIENA